MRTAQHMITGDDQFGQISENRNENRKLVGKLTSSNSWKNSVKLSIDGSSTKDGLIDLINNYPGLIHDLVNIDRNWIIGGLLL